jgi:threonylcarbamoyladenosine tRNA methylthiotransferase MtaB
MPSFAIRNFGCRVNQAEAFAWAETFREAGLRHEDDWGRSDLILVNSCTLTSRADRDVRKFIRQVSLENPAARLVVTGCFAERARAEVEKMPQVVLVLPNTEKPGLPERVMSLLGRPELRAGEDPAGFGAPFRSRAHLKVQDGCDDRCTFCVIPSVRGKSTSLGEEEAVARVRDLVGHGFREIVLAGIHLSSYGENRVPPGSLLDLLRELEKVEGLSRLRLSSLDPRRTDAALLEHVAGNPKICQHFHFSVQHASGRVLREMGRAGGADACQSLLAALRERSPDASLGADVITGFPGETEEDFACLRDFLRRSPLTYFHVFSYSRRAGTPAADRPQVPGPLKKLRSLALRRLSSETDHWFRSSFAGRELDAVVIRPAAGRRAARGGRTEVLTGNAIRVTVPSCPAPAREIVRVRIDRALPHSTEGSIVQSPSRDSTEESPWRNSEPPLRGQALQSMRKLDPADASPWSFSNRR